MVAQVEVIGRGVRAMGFRHHCRALFEDPPGFHPYIPD